MAGTSPTQRTLKANTALGRKCGIVERFVQRPGTFGFRKDLFGFIDLIAISPEDGTVGIQSCGSAYSEHVKKITTEEEVPANVLAWLATGNTAELWAWRKVKLKRGGKAMRWRPRIADIVERDGVVAVIERK